MKQFFKDNFLNIVIILIAIFSITLIKGNTKTITDIKADTVKLIKKDFTIDLSKLKKIKKGGSLTIVVPNSDNEFTVDTFIINRPL